MNRQVNSTILCVLTITLGLAANVQAQSATGTVAALVGTLQIQRGETSQEGSIGAPVFAGDRLRTGASDQAKLVFRDDSVIDLAPNTELSLDTQTFDQTGRRSQSLLHLSAGKVRAWVGESYRAPRSRYEVETATAIVRVRGAEVITVYDRAADLTDVVCITGEVEVVGTLGVIGGNVQVGPRFHSEIAKGRFPGAAQGLDAMRLRQYATGLEIVGTGRREGLNMQHPAVAGRLLMPQDVPGPAAPGAPAAGAEGVVVEAPWEFLADQLSPDVRVNTQPLLDFERTPPGQVPSGAVKVQF